MLPYSSRIGFLTVGRGHDSAHLAGHRKILRAYRRLALSLPVRQLSLSSRKAKGIFLPSPLVNLMASLFHCLPILFRPLSPLFWPRAKTSTGESGSAISIVSSVEGTTSLSSTKSRRDSLNSSMPFVCETASSPISSRQGFFFNFASTQPSPHLDGPLLTLVDLPFRSWA